MSGGGREATGWIKQSKGRQCDLWPISLAQNSCPPQLTMPTIAADDWAHCWGNPHCDKTMVPKMRSAAAEGWRSNVAEQTKKRATMWIVASFSHKILSYIDADNGGGQLGTLMRHLSPQQDDGVEDEERCSRGGEEQRGGANKAEGHDVSLSCNILYPP
jgi:hypothetical protein